MTLQLQQIIAWIIVGLIVGWLGGRVVKSERGLVIDLIVGLIGAIVGGLIFFLLSGRTDTTGLVGSIIVAIVGAVILTAVIQAIMRRRAA